MGAQQSIFYSSAGAGNNNNNSNNNNGNNSSDNTISGENNNNNNNNSYERIVHNQTRLPDHLLREILACLCLATTSKHQIANQLEMSLVCTYWMLHIVPRATKHVTVGSNQTAFLRRFPILLKQLSNNISATACPEQQQYTQHYNVNDELQLTKLTIIFSGDDNDTASNAKEDPKGVQLLKRMFMSQADKVSLSDSKLPWLQAYSPLLAKHWGHCHSLSLFNLPPWENLSHLISCQTNVRTLRVVAMHNIMPQFVNVLYKAKSIVNVSFSSYHVDLSHNSEYSNCSVPHHVQHLKLQPFHRFSGNAALPNLVKLQLTVSRDHESHGLKPDFFRLMPNITDLTLIDANFINPIASDGTSQACILAGLPNLKRLSLSAIYKSTQASDRTQEALMIDNVRAVSKHLEILKLKQYIVDDLSQWTLLLDQIPRLRQLTYTSSVDAANLSLLAYMESSNCGAPLIKLKLQTPSHNTNLCRFIEANQTIKHLTLTMFQQRDIKNVLESVKKNQTLHTVQVDYMDIRLLESDGRIISKRTVYNKVTNQSVLKLKYLEQLLCQHTAQLVDVH
ncbi:hypothetical protein SAMD00019534_084160, partial [Acytostelium subglobosum LB1]|uniref:hypothetical protein n=1 Tax=Acytostelium subglobosum LB1 TaxID=1410327 RepID=UPI0006449077